MGDGSVLEGGTPVQSPADAAARMLEKRAGAGFSKNIDYAALSRVFGGNVEPSEAQKERMRRSRSRSGSVSSAAAGASRSNSRASSIASIAYMGRPAIGEGSFIMETAEDITSGKNVTRTEEKAALERARRLGQPNETCATGGESPVKRSALAASSETTAAPATTEMQQVLIGSVPPAAVARMTAAVQPESLDLPTPPATAHPPQGQQNQPIEITEDEDEEEEDDDDEVEDEVDYDGAMQDSDDDRWAPSYGLGHGSDDDGGGEDDLNFEDDLDGSVNNYRRRYRTP